jgi:hypothetical protein
MYNTLYERSEENNPNAGCEHLMNVWQKMWRDDFGERKGDSAPQSRERHDKLVIVGNRLYSKLIENPCQPVD